MSAGVMPPRQPISATGLEDRGDELKADR